MSSKPRNPDIRKAYDRELDLQTRSVKSKKSYKRKPKYVAKDY